nr:MAG TPA: hypothetical protein [Caudoviricetes sp.]
MAHTSNEEFSNYVRVREYLVTLLLYIIFISESIPIYDSKTFIHCRSRGPFKIY